jgi:hypothetical protein
MPVSNSALNKFTKDTPELMKRRAEMELVYNEFNDKRTQVIKRLFNEVSLYNELFDKNKTMGNTIIEFSLGKELSAFKDSIDKAKTKLEEKENRPFDDVIGSYSKVINAVNAYINSTGSKTGNIKGLTDEIQQMAPKIYELFLEGITKFAQIVDEDETDEQDYPKNNDLIPLWALFEKLQSGYAEGQELFGKNMASSLALSESEKARLLRIIKDFKNYAGFASSSTGENVATQYLGRDNIDFVPSTITTPAYTPLPSAPPSGTTTPLNPNRIRLEEIDKRINVLEEERNKANQDNNIEEVRRINGEIYSLMEEYRTLLGSGRKKGGRIPAKHNKFLQRTMELIKDYPGFPYFVPPSKPHVKSVNPRSRVNNRTEGNGKKAKTKGKPKYNKI